MNNDLISRDAFRKYYCEINCGERQCVDYADRCSFIDELMHFKTEPERTKGQWAFDEKGYFYCNKCGKYPHDQYATTDFCPNCGSDMRDDSKECTDPIIKAIQENNAKYNERPSIDFSRMSCDLGESNEVKKNEDR